MSADVVVEQDYDSNIFSQEHGAQGSAVTIVRPALHLDNTGTLGHARLDGWVSSHTFWSESKLDGVDRGVGGDVDRTIFPRFNLFANGSYQHLAAHAEIRGAETVTFVESPGVPSEPVISPGQLIEGNVPDVNLGQGEFGARYLLTPRSKLSVSGGPFSIDYLANDIGRPDLRDRSGWFGRVALDHDLSTLDSLSFELAATSTDLANSVLGVATIPNFLDPLQPSHVDVDTGKTTSDQESVSLGWNRTWSELWTTRFSVGVRRLTSKTTNAMEPITFVAPAPGGVQSFTSFTPTDFESIGPGLIGDLSIQRVFPRGRAILSYERETRTTSSLAASDVNVDTVTLSYTHRLSERATLTTYGSFEHYVSANDSTRLLAASYVQGSFNPITGPEYSCDSVGGMLVETGSGPTKGGQCSLSGRSRLTSDAWYASARIDWQLRKHLSTFVALRFVERSGDVQLFGNPYNKFNGGVGFRYDYDLGY